MHSMGYRITSVFSDCMCACVYWYSRAHGHNFAPISIEPRTIVRGHKIKHEFVRCNNSVTSTAFRELLQHSSAFEM